MATTLFITHRRMVTSADGTHRHVGWVKLASGRVLSREDVFRWMAAGTVFRTFSPSGHQATVIRVHCRRCSHDYLRTDRDMWKDDNLDELPTF